MAGTAVKVYHGNLMMLPDVARVLACLHEKDVKFELININQGRLPMPIGFLRLQEKATNRVPGPAFEDGRSILFESRAICRHLAEKYEDQGNRHLLGRDPLERAAIEQWLRSEEHSFDPPSWTLVFHLAFAGLNMEVEPNRVLIQDSERKLSEVLDVYNQRLGETKYLAGNEFSLADLSHLPHSHYIANSKEWGYLINSRKHVKKWWKKVSERASWLKAIETVQRLPMEGRRRPSSDVARDSKGLVPRKSSPADGHQTSKYMVKGVVDTSLSDPKPQISAPSKSQTDPNLREPKQEPRPSSDVTGGSNGFVPRKSSPATGHQISKSMVKGVDTTPSDPKPQMSAPSKSPTDPNLREPKQEPSPSSDVTGDSKGFVIRKSSPAIGYQILKSMVEDVDTSPSTTDPNLREPKQEPRPSSKSSLPDSHQTSKSTVKGVDASPSEPKPQISAPSKSPSVPNLREPKQKPRPFETATSTATQAKVTPPSHPTTSPETKAHDSHQPGSEPPRSVGSATLESRQLQKPPKSSKGTPEPGSSITTSQPEFPKIEKPLEPEKTPKLVKDMTKNIPEAPKAAWKPMEKMGGNANLQGQLMPNSQRQAQQPSVTSKDPTGKKPELPDRPVEKGSANLPEERRSPSNPTKAVSEPVEPEQRSTGKYIEISSVRKPTVVPTPQPEAPKSTDLETYPLENNTEHYDVAEKITEKIERSITTESTAIKHTTQQEVPRSPRLPNDPLAIDNAPVPPRSAHELKEKLLPTDDKTAIMPSPQPEASEGYRSPADPVKRGPEPAETSLEERKDPVSPRSPSQSISKVGEAAARSPPEQTPTQISSPDDKPHSRVDSSPQPPEAGQSSPPNGSQPTTGSPP